MTWKLQEFILMKTAKQEVWFITGSQDLYGEETLRQVAEDSKKIAQTLSRSKTLPVKVVFKPTLTTPDAVTELCINANSSANCIGLICWMHTFSPAKMWITGLKVLQKPFVHLHTQFNRDIPWDSIDMDFMNLNQSAMGAENLASSAPVSVKIAKLWSVTGRTPMCKINSVCGSAQPWHVTILRVARLPALVTTCVKWL